MPIIQGYDEHIAAMGSVEARATPDDFGAQIGMGMQRLGAGMQDAADATRAYAVKKSVTEEHVKLTQGRAWWTQDLVNRSNAATPGDETFVPNLVKDINKWVEDGANAAATPEGRRLWQTMGAQMSTEFAERAIGIQGELAAKEAKNQHDALTKSASSAVYNDATQLDSVLANARAAVNDPKGLYAKVSAPVREQLLKSTEQDIHFAAASGIARRDPQVVLGSVAPDQLSQFKPWQSLIDANTAPGGHATIAPETMAKASEFTAEASAKALNPNILMAQNDANAVKQAPKDQAAAMSTLVNRYGGDYAKALAAYKMGTTALDEVLQAQGPNWQASIPQDAQAYVNTVMTKAGAVASSAPQPVAAQPPVPSGPPVQPVSSTIPALNGLTWEQQDHIIKESVQLQHMRMTMAVHARNEQQFQAEQQQKTVMDGMLQQIVEPKKFGQITEDAILTNPTLQWQQKQHMIDYMFTRQRELKAGADSKTNPEEVRRLLLQLYANPDDPNKTYSMDPAMESYRNGRISTNEMMLIRREVDGLRDGSSNSFQKQVNSASTVVHDTFSKSVAGTLNPAVAAEGWYRFKLDMDQQIQAKRAANEDPRPLLDPSSRDYLLKPERLKQFTAGAKEAIKNAVGVAVEQQKTQLPTYKDFDKLKSGDAFTDPQGRPRRKP